MSSEPEPKTGRDVIENGLRNISSFLKARSLPGKAKINRPGAEQGSQQQGLADGTRGLSPQKPASEETHANLPSSSAAQPRGGASPQQQLAHSLSHLKVAAGTGSLPSSTPSTPPAAAATSTSSPAIAAATGSQPAADTAAPSSTSSSPDGPDPAAAAAAAVRSNGGGGEASGGGLGVSSSRASSSIRVKKFHKLLEEQVVNLDALRELAWSGIPEELRPMCWRLLLGYLPPNRGRQAAVLARKRREYADMVPEFYDISNSERTEDEIGALRQVSVDVPRTAPTVPFFHEPIIQKSLERMLYIWGIRHPASGYVQGMNDLVTPFLAVFLSEHLVGSMEAWSAEDLDEVLLLEVEADCYWCLSKLLEGIQDHYTYAQPGIQRTVFRLKELMRKQHEPLVTHLEGEGIDFLQFAFRWVNCLLIREVPFHAAIRLWDTYLAEGTKFSDFLVYVCAAFLGSWQREVVSREFQELMMFLQKLPTGEWGEPHMEVLLSNAYVLRNTWGNAQSHMQS